MTSDPTIRLSDLIQPSAKQRQCLTLLRDEVTTEVLYGGGAGGGKSFIGCVWLVRNCLKYAGTRWLMGRSELKTLKQTTLNTFFEVAAIFKLTAGVDYVFNQQSGSIRFSQGSEIILADLKLYPTDPNFDSLGSLEITGAFIDECNQITEKAWNIVKSRIRYKLDRYGLIPKILGTCNPAKNYVYSRFYKPFKSNTLPADRAFVSALVTDNPHISKHYLNNLQGLDEVSKQRLLYGNFEYDDDAAVLIQYDKIVDLWSNSHVQGGSKYITCDAARFGGDAAKIAVWDGWRVIEWSSYPKCSMTFLADEIERKMTQHGVPASNVVVDEDGVGGGVVDIFRDYKRKQIKGFINNSAPIEERTPDGMAKPNYTNLKSQCSYRFADRVNKGSVYIGAKMSIEEKEFITQDLEQVKQKDVDKDGKKGIVPKNEIRELTGRSPDGGDTLMFREYFELKPFAAPLKNVGKIPGRL